METKDAKVAQVTLESDIYTLVKEFEERTGLKVQHINLDHAETYRDFGIEGHLVRVRTEVRL